MGDLQPIEQVAIYGVLGIAILGLLYAYFLVRQILPEDKGTAKMVEVWSYIRTGANAYLRQQIRTIALLIGVLAILLFFSAAVVPPTEEAKALGSTVIGLGRAGAFLMGAIFSAMVGFIGMNIAVQGNVRVAAAARKSFGDALRIAYRSGTVTGMLTDGLGLLGGTLIFILFGKAAPDVLLGFGFGGTLLALFMRVGGGIYTKAADVGADLVGKVEQDLPEDDPRNAAVIADLVGDNVGDCAGMAADIFESYEVTIVSALILGLALVSMPGNVMGLKWIIFPLLVRGIGVFSSIIGTYLVRVSGGGRNAMAAINRGFYGSAAISITLFAILTAVYMRYKDAATGADVIDWRPAMSVIVGIILAIVIDEVTKYFTDTHHAPVQEIAKATIFGPATTILSGLVTGYESSVAAVLVIGGSILGSVLIWSGASAAFILYGVAMTGIGMLTLTGNNVAMDTFGPISDNANGIGEMSGLEGDARQTLADLDAVGNTTKAITKGVAIGSAVIAAVSLFGSFLTDIGRVEANLGIPAAERLTSIRIDQPLVFVGMLIGGAIPLMFGALAIQAVSRAAGVIMSEVRAQFRRPGVLEGKVIPDYARCVSISTSAAQRELLNLGLLAVLTPIVVGFLLHAEALGGFLAGIILSGQLLAVFMSNAGGSWDNAKKTIEDEPRSIEKNTGKGSERHKASVVGDTVGDPLKDTAGPALNPMIKVINLVSVIIAPIIVTFRQTSPIVVVAMLVLLGVIIWAVLSSRKQADYGVSQPATTPASQVKA